VSRVESQEETHFEACIGEGGWPFRSHPRCFSPCRVPRREVKRAASIAPIFHAQTRTMLYVVALPSVFAAKPGWALSNPETSMAKWLTASEIAAVVSGGTAIKLEKDLFSKAGIAMNLLNQEHAAAGVAALR